VYSNHQLQVKFSLALLKSITRYNNTPNASHKQTQLVDLIFHVLKLIIQSITPTCRKTCYRPKYIMQALTKIYRLPQHKNKSQSCWFHGGKITGIWKRLLCLHIRNCQMIAPLYMWVNPWKVRKFGTTYLPLHICLHGVIYVLYTIMNNLIWFEYFNPIG
jgi:hypothetical protein